METFVAQTEEALADAALNILGAPFPDGCGAVITLQGDLGAGKTALTQAIARHLGITEHVTSPTFVIMKSYPVTHHERFTTLTHIDAYRIESERELSVLGFSELLRDPARLTVIEWPERIPGLIPASARRVTITIEPDNARTITYA